MSIPPSAPRSIAIVGNAGATNVGESLRRAATAAGHRVLFFNAYDASRGPRLIKSLAWRLNDRRPVRLRPFLAELLDTCAKAPPDILIATGMAPLTRSALCTLKAMGVVCVNYSTDDPWNPTARARWFLRALPEYAAIFTPREANIGDFRGLGCTDVRYLPFGYDETLFAPSDDPAGAPSHDVLFVGGADPERAAFMAGFMRSGPPVALVGDYWDRFAATRPQALGHMLPAAVRSLTAAAKVNLCLVRRLNRDGHVMRSFEIAAMGACMLVEDTPDHRQIFGQDGACVAYFSSSAEAAHRARILLADAGLRDRMTASVRDHISNGAHRYSDRLKAILQHTLSARCSGAPGARP